jgi:hypothetical protein
VTQNSRQSTLTPAAFTPGAFTARKIAPFVLLAVLLVVPLTMSNRPSGTALGVVFLFLLFFFPGYLLVGLVSKFDKTLQVLLSFVFGIAAITTVFDFLARSRSSSYFFYIVPLLSVAGMILMFLRSRFQSDSDAFFREGQEIIVAGSAVALSVGPFLWKSGRFSGSEFVFYGPAGKDPLFHVTLLQRLLSHVPPDNFIVSGLRPPVYHYFGDLGLALVLRAEQAWHVTSTNLFDLYFRTYPVFLYFLLGALAYRVGKQLVGTRRGGVLGIVLLLGGGGLGWALGALQTASHAAHFATLRSNLFSTWTAWDGVDAILPLFHRPAHYHGLLFSLAAITILLQPQLSRWNWALAGLLLGLMSGFNFTLAATFGGMAVVGVLIFAWRQQRSEAVSLLWLANFIFMGSIPVLSAMLLSGFHDNAPGFPFRGPNLEFPMEVWGTELARIVPSKLVPWAALIALPIFAYGFLLFGLPSMARVDLGETNRRSLAMLLALVFVASFVVGVFFPYNALGGEAIIFLQPSIWILALFSIRPIDAWFTRNHGSWATVGVWSVLVLTWIQALASFNFGQRAEFSQETAQALQDVQAVAAREDVVAYLPSELVERPIFGFPGLSTNFAITAMTGLDGYFSGETYSTFFAVPGLRGATPADIMTQAKGLYDQRVADVNSFVSGDVTDVVSTRLANDHVRWIVVSGAALRNISSSANPWRKTGEIVIYRLSR